MGMVRAKVDCLLAPEHGGYKSKDDEFEYMGPDNENLEAINQSPYETLGREDLKDELVKRKIRFAQSTTDENLRAQLVADDNKQA